MVDVVRNPQPIGNVPNLSAAQSLPTVTSPLLPLDMALREPDPHLPETETYAIDLVKDELGLGITVAGYVCEKEEISGIFVKSISKGSAADLTGRIKINDRITEVRALNPRGLLLFLYVQVCVVCICVKMEIISGQRLHGCRAQQS